jgi:hypothetical protein
MKSQVRALVAKRVAVMFMSAQSLLSTERRG